jgi:hypothetical protein
MLMGTVHSPLRQPLSKADGRFLNEQVQKVSVSSRAAYVTPKGPQSCIK